MKKVLLLLVSLLTLFSVASAHSCQDNPLYCQWLIYYNSEGNVADFQPYNPIVFDADRHPDLEPLQHVKKLLGHVSLGEVNQSRSYFNTAQNSGLLIAPMPDVPGSWYVDIRKPFWKSLMIETVIPSILNQGFTGIMIDNLDTPIYLEQINPAAYPGMVQAAIDLVIEVRNAFPEIPIMLNGAYQILSSVGGHITYALGSSVLTTYNTETERYEFVPLTQYQTTRNYLQDAQELFPNLIIMSLDFWEPADAFTLKRIYNQEYKNGFRPYVTSFNLQSITPSP